MSRLAEKSTRARLLARVHIAQKDLALSEDSYRDLVLRVTEKSSCRYCTEAELRKVLDEFERLGWRPGRKKSPAVKRPRSDLAPLVGKMRALWLCLFNLGELESGSETALDKFVTRQTGAAHINWLQIGQCDSVIEALKAMCARAGYDVPADVMDAKRTLVRLQWTKLHELRAVQDPDRDALDRWLTPRVSPHRTSLNLLSARQLDLAAGRLGTWLRRAKKAANE